MSAPEPRLHTSQSVGQCTHSLCVGAPLLLAAPRELGCVCGRRLVMGRCVCCPLLDNGTHAWCGHATVMVFVSSASGAARERLHSRAAIL